jgi:hypothetical protein
MEYTERFQIYWRENFRMYKWRELVEIIKEIAFDGEIEMMNHEIRGSVGKTMKRWINKGKF